jgi:hypothetical protein
MPTAEGQSDATTEDQTPPIEPPKRALHALTTDELKARRRELMHAIKGIPADAPIKADLRRWLDDLPAEEKDRVRITDG